MKVGKPKSKRVPVRLRHKIEKASAAKQRKQRKEAKKNPQWRSRCKKDPGIPNLFPYKAKVLAEIEESKRKKEEEAVRRREIAKAQRQGTALPVGTHGASKDVQQEEEDDDVLIDDASDIEDDDEGESMDDEDSSNPMAALLASAQARADAYPQPELSSEDDDEEEDADQWNGIQDTTTPTIESAKLQQKGLPQKAISDPIKTISKLLERLQEASGGIQLLLDYYEIPPLVTAGSDLNTRLLVEVARKRGRLGKGGVPNLHSAALTVLGDVHDGRLVLPAMETKVEKKTAGAKGEVRIVKRVAKPFTIEGLWGEDEGSGVGTIAVEERMIVEAEP